MFCLIFVYIHKFFLGWCLHDIFFPFFYFQPLFIYALYSKFLSCWQHGRQNSKMTWPLPLYNLLLLSENESLCIMRYHSPNYVMLYGKMDFADVK